MRSIIKITLVTALMPVVSLFLGVLTVKADELVVPFNGSFSGVGPLTGEYYRGQTFSGPGGSAQQLTIYISSVDLGKAKVRILLTDVDTSSGIHPTNVLFESSTLEVPFSVSSSQPVTVDLGGIPLLSGQTYAWIIDAFADYDPAKLWSGQTGMDLNGTYEDGDFIRLVTGPFPPAGDRSDHFAMNWFLPFPARDMAFRLSYTPLAAQEVAVDIRPQGCPNPLALPSNGYLPVAIAGTYDLDVYQIDQASIRLEGVPPMRSAFENVTTPFEPVTGKFYALDCSDYGPDGYDDLTLKFASDAVIAAIGDDVENRDVRILTLTGSLLPDFGGDEIVGEDVVVIIKPMPRN